MAMQVTCPLCGQTVTGDDEDALVAAADAHGDENHGMRAPREMREVPARLSRLRLARSLLRNNK